MQHFELQPLLRPAVLPLRRPNTQIFFLKKSLFVQARNGTSISQEVSLKVIKITTTNAILNIFDRGLPRLFAQTLERHITNWCLSRQFTEKTKAEVERL